MPNEQQLILKIVCHTFPGLTFHHWRDVELAVQCGPDPVEAVSGDADHAVFLVPLRVGKRPGGQPNFLGPYAQGTPTERFVYLHWSGVDSETGVRSMFRRGKIKLGHLTWEQIERAIAEARPITVQVAVTARDGGPGCGSKIDSLVWEE